MQTTVFYDGKCSLCAKEIAYYQKISPQGVLRFIDLTQDMSLFKQHGKDLATGLKQLHVLDKTGVMQMGLNAFICIWQLLPKWRILAFIVKLPIIHFCLSQLYRTFAYWRFKKNGYDHCNL